MRYLEHSKSLRKKAAWSLPVHGGKGDEELLFNRGGVPLPQDEKSPGAGWWGGLHSNGNVLHTTELCLKSG